MNLIEAVIGGALSGAGSATDEQVRTVDSVARAYERFSRFGVPFRVRLHAEPVRTARMGRPWVDVQ